jgi:CRISPR-associated protein Csx3
MYPADELEAGPANLYLRVRDGSEGTTAMALLGPGSASSISWTSAGPVITGSWGDLQYTVTFRLADALASWYWHVRVTNRSPFPTQIDVVYAQDLALAPYGALRTCEYYVSQYLDLTPVQSGSAGTALAVRQNMPGPTTPWAVIGCLSGGQGWATDALQLVGRAHHAGAQPLGLSAMDLPSTRLQHEHTLAQLQSRPVQLAEGESMTTGFFGAYQPDHPASTSSLDSAVVDQVLAQPEAQRPAVPTPADDHPAETPAGTHAAPSSLFSSAAALTCVPLDDEQLLTLAGQGRQHAEWDGQSLLSYFAGDGSHVVTSAKQTAVLRPHGHVMRTGTALVPDEGSLTTTAWMAGTFHSQVTQGHASLNRLLSTRRSYLGLRQAQGLRIFVAGGDGDPNGWTLLDEPSAWSVSPDTCRWWYAHDGVLLEVVSSAPAQSHELGLQIRVVKGPALSFLICANVALDGDDGQDCEPPLLEHDGGGVTVRPLTGSLAATRFPAGSFRFSWDHGSIEQVGRDEALFLDGQSRDLPWITMRTAPATQVHLALTANLVPAADLAGQDLLERDQTAPEPPFWDGISSSVQLRPPADSPLAGEVSRLNTVLPWFAHDALVHYLSPRGLEQSTGGAWGTRDVCQGPVGLLIALGETAPLRDLMLRVFGAQNARGDWPQSFEFYPRECRGGQGDAHGDVVFWPVLALGEYLAVTNDASLFAELIPFVGDHGATAAEPLLEHVRRALAAIAASTVPGSPLPAYGNGDWNDSLQPADPLLAAHLASTWTATLQVHALRTLAGSLRTVNARLACESSVQAAEAAEYAGRCEQIAAETAEAMHTLLMRDGVLAGYGLFGEDGSIEHLVHPSDQRTGLRYGLLQIIHAISGDLLTPSEACEHLHVLDEHLIGPDGARLFDRPARYHGGPMEVFKRAEASTFFGREIGIMYTHAHLRYAEALARHGDAEQLLEALALANPIGVTERIPNARPRQSTCYYSSSDAAFADRYEAAEHYGDVMAAAVPLEGGWRVYSSGPGIFLRLVVENLLGVRRRGDRLEIDPVLAPALDRLQATVPLEGAPLDLTFRVGTRGVGPLAVTLNGVRLATTPLSNPYRPAGVAIDMALVRAAMRDSGGNHLEIQVS